MLCKDYKACAKIHFWKRAFSAETFIYCRFGIFLVQFIDLTLLDSISRDFAKWEERVKKTYFENDPSFLKFL